MNGYFATQIGRRRADEAIAQADRYRLMQPVRRGADTDPWRPRRLGGLLYRRVLAAVALSMLVLLGTASMALAGPSGLRRDPGAGAPIRGNASATADAGLDWGRVAFASGAMLSVLVVLAYGIYVARRQEHGSPLTRGTVL